MADNYGLFSIDRGLLCGMATYYLGLLDFPGRGLDMCKLLHLLISSPTRGVDWDVLTPRAMPQKSAVGALKACSTPLIP